jgi:hypothetical protein
LLVWRAIYQGGRRESKKDSAEHGLTSHKGRTGTQLLRQGLQSGKGLFLSRGLGENSENSGKSSGCHGPSSCFSESSINHIRIKGVSVIVTQYNVPSGLESRRNRPDVDWASRTRVTESDSHRPATGPVSVVRAR